MILPVTGFGDSKIEVVQSVPIETNLEVPGIRLTQQVWLDMINSAQNSIDLEEFYIGNKSGEALEPVLSAISAAASRGVHVRLLVDSKFYKNYSQDPNRLNQIPNIQVRIIDFASGVQHSKYFIVDQDKIYVGSANFDWLALRHIHEIGLHITDPVVGKDLESVFAKDWEEGSPVQMKASFGMDLQSYFTSLLSSPSGSFSPSELRVVASPPSRNPEGVADSLTAILDLLSTAKKSIKIQVYQYSTKANRSSSRWTALDSAIRAAAARGIQVQLLVDAVALKAGRMDLKALASLKGLEVRTVSVPEWSGGHLDFARLIHSKYFTVDGASAWVGTENWSEGYFSGSRNVGVTLQSNEISGQLERVFNRVWSSAYTSPL